MKSTADILREARALIDTPRFRCDYCGRFVSMRERNWIRKLAEPDSHFGPERYDTYHFACVPAIERAEQEEA